MKKNYLDKEVKVIHRYPISKIHDPRTLSYPVGKDIESIDMFVGIFTRFGRKRERYTDDIVNALGGKVELKDDHEGRYMVLTIHALVDDVQDIAKKVYDYCVSKDLRFDYYGYETINRLGDV